MPSADGRGQRPVTANYAAALNIANSNNTSNLFLGFNQKPWMTSNGTGNPTAQARQPSNMQGQPVANKQSSTPRQPSVFNNTPRTAVQRISNTPDPVLRPSRSVDSPTHHLPSPARSEDQPYDSENIGGHSDPNRAKRLHATGGPMQKRVRLDTNQAPVMTPAITPHTPTASLASSSVQSRNMYQDQQAPPRASVNGQAPQRFSTALLDVMARHDAFIASQGGLTALNNVSVMRLRIITSALQEQDEFFLYLHQLFSLATFNHGVLCGLPYIQMPQLQGIKLLEPLFTSNASMQVAALQHCAMFPYPLELLAQHYPDYPMLQSVSRFLYHFGLVWPQLRDNCLQRQCPLWPEEQFQWLGLTSPLLQKILFTALHRQLGALDLSPWSQECMHMLDESQISLKQNMQRTAEPGWVQDNLTPRIQRYKQLRQHGLGLLGPFSSPQLIQSTAHPSSHFNPQAYTRIQNGPVSSSNNPGLSHRLTEPLPYGATTPLPSRPTISSNENTPSSQPQLPGTRQNLPLAQRPTSRTGFLSEFQSSNAMHTGSAFWSEPSIQGYPDPHGQFANLSSRHLQNSVVSGNSTQCVAGPTMSRQNTDPLLPASNTPPSQIMSQTPRAADSGTAKPSFDFSEQMFDRFFAEAGHEMTQSTAPNPSRIALHQAHLSTPLALKMDKTGREGTDIRLYQYLSSFALRPVALGIDCSFYSWEFHVPAAAWRNRALMSKQATLTEPAKRWYTDGACLFRLRCVSNPPPITNMSENEWTVKDSVWPSSCFVFCNDNQLEVRRKHHYGKDLPLDLTNSIHEGVNNITLSILRNRDELTKRLYAVAIEVIEVGDDHRIHNFVSGIPSATALAAITNPLQRTPDSPKDEDDILLLDPHVSIDLIDPFTAKIFDIPARGRYCLHRECFDLETFLQTRKSRSPGAPTSADEWKCPICRLDARPESLVVDGFLKEVREQLQHEGVEDARAILVKPDGSWEVKKDGGTDREGRKGFEGMDRDVKDDDNDGAGASGGGIESLIIDLDDDDDDDDDNQI